MNQTMRPEENVETSIFTIMKKMDTNTKLIVPIEQWALVRNYALDLEIKLRAKYKVRRMMTPRTKLNLILVERVE